MLRMNLTDHNVSAGFPIITVWVWQRDLNKVFTKITIKSGIKFRIRYQYSWYGARGGKPVTL